MSNKAYVHNETTLTCTNGFKTSNILVENRGVTIANGKLPATIEDKPCNFACKWAGVLAALVAAACIAAPFIIAVLAAFVIGMAVALTIGQLLCWVALRGGKWTDFHPKVHIKGHKALVESSKLKCLILGGDIKIFFDKETAQKELRNNQFRNTVEIFGAAFIGRAFFTSIKANGFLGAAKGFLLTLPQNLALGYGVVEGANVISNVSTGRDWNNEAGNSLPFFGDEKSYKDRILSDYQKTATEPIGNPTSEVNYYTDDKIIKSQGRLDEFEQKQSNKYKSDNPVHKYSKGKRSKHYGRQQKRQQKLNNKARRIAAQDRSRLSQRYKGRVENTAKRNFTRSNYGLLAFFAVSEIIAQHLEKSLDNELQRTNNPEYASKASTKVFATDL